MASINIVSETNIPIPFKTIEEANNHLIEKLSEENDAFIASLPLHPSVERPINFINPFRLYKGVWIPENFLRGALVMQKHLNSRPTDIFLASYPKSGTTWLKALLFATLTRHNYPLDQHPLRSHNPHQCVPYMEQQFGIGRSKIIEAFPSPRVMSTHLPYNLLPDSITDSDCRIVYVWRDPKDVSVSLWSFIRNILGSDDKIVPFHEFYESIYTGEYAFGPIWDHVLGYWEESKRRPEKILFLKYEDILREPVKHAKDLAHFIGCPYSEAEEKHGVVEQIVNLCSFKALKDSKVSSGTFSPNISHEHFFRKGEAGDWRSHMTQEMAEKLDAVFEEKFTGSGLKI